jgi:biopolymer transport protein ExbB
MRTILLILTLLFNVSTFAQTAPTLPGQDAPTQQDAGGGLHQQLKQRFIDGRVPYMLPILITLVLGLSISIERIIYLNRAHINSQKLLRAIEPDILAGRLDAAAETCRNTRGPVASMILQGIERAPYGMDVMEKSIMATGNSQMSLLERGLTWISLFISLAPIFGFFGTVVGIFLVFEEIEMAGDIAVSIVAGGMKVKLITTIGGLIVAIILQVFYNYIVSKVDNIVHDMEEGAILFVDMLLKSGYYAKTNN